MRPLIGAVRTLNRPEAAPAARDAGPDRLLRWTPAAAAILGAMAWELSARAGLVSTLFYPPPSVIGRALVRMLQSGELMASLGASCSRILLGAALGGGAGLLLGLCLGWSRRLRLVLDPVIAAVHPVPKLAVLPLILLLFGVGETARLIVISMSGFFPMIINTTAGVRQLDAVHFEVARNYGARPRQVFTWVVLPGAVPSILSGARLSLVGALRTTLAIELITADRGLGHLIWFAWETFRTEELYAALFVIAVLGFGVNFGLERVTPWLMPWRPRAPR